MSHRQKLLSEQDSVQNSGQIVHAHAFSLKPETVKNNGKQTLWSGPVLPHHSVHCLFPRRRSAPPGKQESPFPPPPSHDI